MSPFLLYRSFLVAETSWHRPTVAAPSWKSRTVCSSFYETQRRPRIGSVRRSKSQETKITRWDVSMTLWSRLKTPFPLFLPPSHPPSLPPSLSPLPPLLPPQDPTNQEAKLQQHQAFEAELHANKGRIDAVVETTEELIEAGHYAADVIRWAELGTHQ